MGLTSSRGKRPARLHSSMMGIRLSSMNLRAVSRTRRSSSVRRVSNAMKSTPRNFRAIGKSRFCFHLGSCGSGTLVRAGGATSAAMVAPGVWRTRVSAPHKPQGKRLTLAEGQSAGQTGGPTAANCRDRLMFFLLRREFVVVAEIRTQAGTESVFSVACRKLLFVMIQIEIEWVSRVQVNQDQIGVAHG